MHIPDQMLNGAICHVTAAVSVAGVASAAILATKSKERPASLNFAATTSLLFAAQMLNFPVLHGTSGHLLGTTLAVSLLGIPFGILAMAFVLTIQSLAFADGGLTVLGANVFNMVLAGAVPGIILHSLIKRKKLQNSWTKNISLFAASWLSVILASLFCSVELGIAGTVGFGRVLPAMLGIHSLIGIGEGVITVMLFSLLYNPAVTRSKQISFGLPLIAAGVMALILSPFASAFPDGLEWVAGKYSFLQESAPYFVSPMADYAVPFVSHPQLSTGIAGIVGAALTFAVVYLTGRLLERKYREV